MAGGGETDEENNDFGLRITLVALCFLIVVGWRHEALQHPTVLCVTSRRDPVCGACCVGLTVPLAALALGCWLEWNPPQIGHHWAGTGCGVRAHRQPLPALERSRSSGGTSRRRKGDT